MCPDIVSLQHGKVSLPVDNVLVASGMQNNVKASTFFNYLESTIQIQLFIYKCLFDRYFLLTPGLYYDIGLTQYRKYISSEFVTEVHVWRISC